MMMAVLHVLLFIVLMGLSGRAYLHQSMWIRVLPYLLLKLAEGRAGMIQLLIYAPIIVMWLLGCHWLDVQGWHGLGASGIGFAMILGLQALRMLEENQKRLREDSQDETEVEM